MELTGRLTADAIIRSTSNNKQVVSFTVAKNHRYKSGGETKTETDYFNCSYWLNTGVAEYLKKGNLVTVTGRITASAYISNGEPKAQLNCRVNEIIFQSSTKTPGTTADVLQLEQVPIDAKTEELPF